MTPQMPIHSGSETGVWIYLAVVVVLYLALLGWWFLRDRREHGAVLPLLLLGSTFCALYEPFLDHLMLWWWPQDQNPEAFQAMGRSFPLIIPVAYSLLAGGFYLIARTIERKPTSRRIWQIFASAWVADWFAFQSAIQLDIAGYYGNQPYQLWDNALWYTFHDAALITFAAAALYVLLPLLTGARKFWLLVTPWFIAGLPTGVIIAPAAVALNSDWSDAAIWIACTATIGLAVLVTYVVSRAVPAYARFTIYWRALAPGNDTFGPDAGKPAHVVASSREPAATVAR